MTWCQMRLSWEQNQEALEPFQSVTLFLIQLNPFLFIHSLIYTPMPVVPLNDKDHGSWICPSLYYVYIFLLSLFLPWLCHYYTLFTIYHGFLLTFIFSSLFFFLSFSITVQSPTTCCSPFFPFISLFFNQTIIT